MKLNKNEIDVLIYHKGCPDGFGAATCAWLYYKQNKIHRDIEYIPCFHGDKLPNLEGKNVLVCDFSFKYPVFQELVSKVKNILILDHHKTSEADLKSVSDDYKVFDMNHSGVYLAWEYFFGDQEMPLFFKYIEDRDIWTKKLPLIEQFSAWLPTIPFEFQKYKINTNDTYFTSQVMSIGSVLYKNNKAIIDTYTRKKFIDFTKIDGKFYLVAYVNCNILKSELGNNLVLEYPNLDFSVVYSHLDVQNKTIMSLRSTNYQSDVSEVSTVFGGGGHRNASGSSFYGSHSRLPCESYYGSDIYTSLSSIYTKTVTIGEKTFNVVYWNQGTLKSKLGKYLLQTKYTEEDSNVQVATTILFPSQTDKRRLETEIHFSCVWHYDGSTDKTYYSIASDETIDKEEFKSFSKAINGEILGTTIFKKYAGVKRNLEINL
jgi:uncharacterized protein